MSDACKHQNGMNKKITLLLPVSNQPRYLKRIHLLVKLGYHITVYYFDRDLQVPEMDGSQLQFKKLGAIRDGNYLKRMLPLLKAVRIIKKDRSPVVYAFSVDLLLAAVLAGKSDIIFEIGDIREVKSTLFNRIYARLLKKCSRIIVTSDKFASYLSETYRVDPHKFVFQPHLLEKHQFDAKSRVRNKTLRSGDALYVGFIGLLRYTSVGRLLEETHDNPRLKIRIHGRGAYRDEVAEKMNTSKDYFGGAFNYPEDLRKIYESIDINFVMYDSSDTNVTMALPNKLYESIYFGTPLIVSSGTYLSEIVQEWEIGLVWDYNRINTLCEYLSSKEFRDQYPEMVRNVIGIPDDDILRKKDELPELFANLEPQH